MDEALDKIKKKTMTKYAASKFYIIPKTTFVQQTQCRAKSQIGRPTIFDKTVEIKIKNCLIDMANVGMPVTKKLLLKGASILAHKMNLDQKVIGTRWARNFFKRHSIHLIRKAQILPKHRTFVSKQDIKTWFQKITEYMDKNDLLSVFEDPNQMWNLDKSSFDLCPSIKHAIGQKNKRLYNITANSDKESFSVMITGNANSLFAPRFVSI